MEGLEWQPIQLPFVGGLNNKVHEHALEPPELVMCQNVEFDEVGGLRLRKPYSTIGSNIYPSGTISDVRRFAVDGDELLLFTKDTLYTWSETLTKWVSRGTHLAVKVNEATRFGNTSDQVFADRAQLGNLIVYVWTEVQAGGTVRCFLAALDATTLAPVISPTDFGASRVRPRVVATDTKILVFWIETGNGAYVTSITPSAPTFTTSGATLINSNQQPYDVVKDPAADQVVHVIRNSAGTAYVVTKITAALGATASTKARVADGIVALSVAPAAADRVQILRTDGNNVRGDLLVVSTLADVFTATAVGAAASTINQLTGAHRSTTDGGFYRCYVFWSAGETSSGILQFDSESNWVDTNNSLGTEAVFLRQQGLASRAFNHEGRIFVWTVFAGQSSGVGSGTTLGVRAQLQNSYFLHRDDGEYIAKSVWSKAGGFGYQSGHLPGVVSTDGATAYAWCGVERQLIATGGTDHSSYGARAPRDVVFTFDSNDARRTVKLGRTLYISGSPLLQYDGEGLAEVGFEQYPWALGVGPDAAGVSSLAAGPYSWKGTWRWDNARGETERSTTATGEQLTVAGPSTLIAWSMQPLHVTRKKSSRRNLAAELWRTKINPVLDSPFYLTTSKDPSVTGVPNEYQPNAPNGVFIFDHDDYTDAILETKEQSPENGGGLPRLAPPPATIMCASDSRLFLAGVAGEPNRIHYSLLRGENEIAAFNSLLSIALPTATGAITALAIMNETLVAFTTTAIYVITGDGFDNLGGGNNYAARLLPSNVGALSQSSVATTPGGLIFFSKKGWYRLGIGWELEYIGANVEDYNTDAVPSSAGFASDHGGWLAAQVVDSQHQVRLLSKERLLVWDYLVNKWAEWTEPDGRDLAMWRGSPMKLTVNQPQKEQTTFTDAAYRMEIETGWIKLSGMQGFGRVRWIEVLGEKKANHQQRIRVARDYQTSYADDRTITITNSTPTQVRHGPSQQRVEAIKVRVTVQASGGGNLNADVATITGLALEVGLKRGLYKRLPAAQKQ